MVTDGDCRMWSVLRGSKPDSQPCSFSSAGLATELPAHPGLHIVGLGDSCPLPLAPEQVKALKSTCQPFIRRSAASGDGHGQARAPLCWALDPRRTSFSNPSWESGLAQLVQRVKQELGAEVRSDAS